MSTVTGFEHISTDLRMFHFLSDYDMHFQLHTNSMVELRCFIRGKGTHFIEGIEYTERPGDLMVIRPGETHYPLVDLSVPYERANVLIGIDLLRSIIGDEKLLEPIFNRDIGTKNLYHADSLGKDPRYFFQKMAEPSPDERSNILAYTILLLQQISDAYQNHRFATYPKNPLSHQILQYVDQNLDQELSIESLCDKFFISSAQLSRIIKKVTGVSVGQYITKKRMNKARFLIRKGKKPSQICASCGYPNYASFYRVYTRHFGCTPKMEYIKATIQST